MKADPYYRTFEHESEHSIRQLATAPRVLRSPRPGFRKYGYAPEVAQALVECIPHSKELGLSSSLVQVFVTAPGFYYRPHKDGDGCRFGINYLLEVPEVNDCLTSWYNDSAVDGVPKEDLFKGGQRVSRELALNVPGRVQPSASRVFTVADGGILFNTDVYHDFHMRRTSGYRRLLTFRSATGLTYEQAVSIFKPCW